MNLSSITVLISCFLLVTCRIHIYCPRVTSTPEARLKMKTACSVFDKLLDLYVSVKKQLRDRLLYSCHPGPLLRVCIPTRAKEFPKAINLGRLVMLRLLRRLVRHHPCNSLMGSNVEEWLLSRRYLRVNDLDLSNIELQHSHL